MPINKKKESAIMDFFKVDEHPILSYEVSGKGKAQKKETSDVSFQEVFRKEKKVYSAPSMGEVSAVSGEDKATISESARTAYELFKLVSLVKKQPDIRKEQIEEARRLLKEGVFRPDINGVIAERITNIFLPR
jgi:hypothetical protein